MQIYKFIGALTWEQNNTYLIVVIVFYRLKKSKFFKVFPKKLSRFAEV